MVSDAGEDICQPSLGIDVVELGSFHEGVDNGCGFAAALGSAHGPRTLDRNALLNWARGHWGLSEMISSLSSGSSRI